MFTSTLSLCVGNAGTAMRPLAGVLCAGQGNFVLDGTPRMRERPIDDLVDGLLQVLPFHRSSLRRPRNVDLFATSLLKEILS